MRYALIIILALGIFAGTAQAAGNQNLCAKNYPDVQSETGGTFSSVAECATYSGKGGALYQPSLTATFVGASTFRVIGSGFHANADLTYSLTANGSLRSSATVRSDAGGAFTNLLLWDCYPLWTSPVQLTITLTDSFGVHASAQTTTC